MSATPRFIRSAGPVMIVLALFVAATAASWSAGDTDAANATAPTVGCDVTFKGTNSSGRDIQFSHSMSRVKVKGGWFKKLDDWQAMAYADGGSLNSMVRLDLGCNKKRLYKLYFTNARDADAACYYPGRDGYTTRLVINLGDVSRYFDPKRSSSSCRG